MAKLYIFLLQCTPPRIFSSFFGFAPLSDLLCKPLTINQLSKKGTEKISTVSVRAKVPVAYLER